MSEYSRISTPYGGPGVYTNPGMVDLVRTYCHIKGIGMSAFYVYQGSFNTTVAASAGTHDKADCMDSSSSIDDNLLKKIGAFAWQRTTSQGFGVNHVHFGRMYSSAMAWLATAQDRAYRGWRSNGLGDLSGKDNSWCPRYRSVKHLSGPTANDYLAVRKTAAFSQAGCLVSEDSDLIKVWRERKFTLTDIAGTVRCRGRDYFVTDGGGFYKTADFIRKWGGFVWLNQSYHVAAEPCYARIGPGLDKAKEGTVLDKSNGVQSIGYSIRDGKKFVVNASGKWYYEGSLVKN